MKKIIAMLLIAALALTSVFAQGGSESSDLDTVRVAYMTNYASLCSLVAGMQTGAFAEQGIEVELVEFADGPTIIAAMESGSIDIGYIGHGAHKLCVNGRANSVSTAGQRSSHSATSATETPSSVSEATGSQKIRHPSKARTLVMHQAHQVNRFSSGLLKVQV